jgi:cell division septation protein DedD
LLALGFTVTSVIVFFLGVLIGQGIEERKLLKKEEPLVKIPIQPLPKGSGSAPGASAKEEMTFYETLAEAPAGAQPTRGKAAKEIKPVEKMLRPAVKETKPAAGEGPAVLAEKTKEKASTEKTPEKTPLMLEVREEPAQKTQKVEEVRAGIGASQDVWAVQVNAFPNERDAKNLVKKLKDKGYDSYVVSTNIKGRNWYRVRVGRFATRGEAKELQETLMAKENLNKAITVSR